MPPIDSATYLEPISDEAPCGPDLDLEGDPDFMNYLASTEGYFPASFFTFDPKTVDFATAVKTGQALLERSRDVRLVVVLARLAILSRSLEDFAGWVHTLRELLAQHWEAVNPRAVDGDYSFRMAPIYTLDDVPVVVLPLQHLPLASSRAGPVNFRQHLIASGKLKPRESEPVIEAGAIDKAFLDMPLEELVALRDRLAMVKSDLADIRGYATEGAGYEQAVRLVALPDLVDEMVAFVEDYVVRRDPGAAQAAAVPAESSESEGAVPASAVALAAGTVASRATADAALASAIAYFERFEPSSPAVLLVRQARQLLGRNLYEVLQILLPAHVDSARVQIGAEPAFTVMINSMASSDGDAYGEADEIAPAETRSQAFALLDQVSLYIRASEPTSPIPLLIERSKLLGSRDFLALLRDLLPEEVLAAFRPPE